MHSTMRLKWSNRVLIGPCASAGHHMELAEKFHALVIAIEHRFYGKTFPSSDLSTKNLRHLSSAQALADIATFIAHARAKFGFGNAPVSMSTLERPRGST